MRKIVLLMLAMMITLGAYAKSDKDTTVSFKIKPAMSCSNCESKIKSNLRFEKGVSAIEANAPGDIVTITFNSEKTNVENLSKAFSKLGYEATPSEPAETGCAAKPCEKSGKTCDKFGKNCDKSDKTCEKSIRHVTAQRRSAAKRTARRNRKASNRISSSKITNFAELKRVSKRLFKNNQPLTLFFRIDPPWRRAIRY